MSSHFNDISKKLNDMLQQNPTVCVSEITTPTSPNIATPPASTVSKTLCSVVRLPRFFERVTFTPQDNEWAVRLVTSAPLRFCSTLKPELYPVEKFGWPVIGVTFSDHARNHAVFEEWEEPLEQSFEDLLGKSRSGLLRYLTARNEFLILERAHWPLMGTTLHLMVWAQEARGLKEQGDEKALTGRHLRRAFIRQTYINWFVDFSNITPGDPLQYLAWQNANPEPTRPEPYDHFRFEWEIFSEAMESFIGWKYAFIDGRLKCANWDVNAPDTRDGRVSDGYCLIGLETME